jgi:hypothetical protein
MNWFRKILGAISYIAVAAGPIIAATGVGMPIGAVIGAVGLAAGATLHFMNNPLDSKAAAEAGVTVKQAIDAVRATKGLPPAGPAGTT